MIFLRSSQLELPLLERMLKNQRKNNSLVCHAQHQYVDIELSEFPVGAVHAQYEFRLDRQQTENHAGDDVKVKDILGKEPLEPTQTGVPVNGCRHGVSQFVEDDGLHHTEGMEYNFDMTDVLLFIVSGL